MSNKPILIFPFANPSTYTKRKISFPALIIPSKENQIRLNGPKLGEIERALTSESFQFASSIEGLIPEMVLVFEIAGTIHEFFKAVEETPGMHYLLEFQDDYFGEGSGFFYRNPDGSISNREIERRIFVTLNSQRGIIELLSYWRRYVYDEEFRRGVTKFRLLFSQLTDIRFYNLNDRLKDTGFREYLEDLRSNLTQVINFEIEFVFHASTFERDLIIQDVNGKLQEIGGEIIPASISVIDDIGYFGAIARAPINAFDNLALNTNVSFLQSHRILFFKPVGQSVSQNIVREEEDYPDERESQSVVTRYESPIVGILDGIPLQNHSKLQNKIIVDDPDDFSALHSAEYRNHGTAMASLIIHGALDGNEEINSKLYVRPILKLDITNNEEKLPDDILVIDLLHRSIKRIFEGEENELPVAPNIKIINFSIGDQFRPFIRSISSWAKLMDYFSYKYKVLFIISSGNYSDHITVPVSLTQFEALSDSEKENLIYRALFDKNYNRKILTPSESVNNLNVGGFHLDGSEFNNTTGLYDPNVNSNLPSPISRIGYGFNHSLKPDILFDSGRILYRIVQSGHGEIVLRPRDGFSNRPPGVKIAISGRQGAINSIGYAVGTSISAALVTNCACKLYEVLDEINEIQTTEDQIPKDYYAVLIKALLVHYSEGSNCAQNLGRILAEVGRTNPKILKEYINQNIGNGILDKSKLGFCTDHRITLLGFGKLKKEEGHIYRFPLPSAISGRTVRKKLAITLAWISPINFHSGKYKMAQLYFDNIRSNQTDLFLDRSGSDYFITRRGTLQHDILENHLADVYVEGSELVIKVSCREQASGLKTREIKYEIEYGLAVSLEVQENTEIRIYDEIKTKIDAIKARIATRVRV
jgi:hypothetical protein